MKRMRAATRQYVEAGKSASEAAVGAYLYDTPASFVARPRAIVRGLEDRVRLLCLERHGPGAEHAGKLFVTGIVNAAPDSDAARQAVPLPDAIQHRYGVTHGFVRTATRKKAVETPVEVDDL